MAKYGRLAFLALALILAGGCGTSAQAPKKSTLLLNYALAGRHAPFFVGIEKGYYKEVGLDLQVLPSSGSGFVATAVDGGQAEFGLIEATALIQAVAKGAKIKMFQAFVVDTPNGLASLKPIPDLKSLLTIKIGSPATSSTKSIMPVIMDLNGLDPEKLQWVTANTASLITLVANGSVDAFGAALDSDVPVLEKILKPQGKKVFYSPYAKWGYDGLGFLFMAKTSLLSERPQDAKGFASATAKAVAFSLANPDAATDIMVKYNPTLDRETTFIQWGYSIEAIETPYKKQHGFGNVTEDRVLRSIELTKKAFKLDNDIKPDEVFAKGFTGN